jgi:hypothetical protein
VQGSLTKSSLKRSISTDERRIGCYANGWRAHAPNGTKPGARHASPSGYSRLSEEARYLRLFAQNNNADGLNVTPITKVALIDPELPENLIDNYADFVNDWTDERVMKILEPAQDSDASATADIVKAEVLAKVSYAVSRKDSALRVIKAVAKYHSLHTNLKLDYTSGKAKTAVEHQVS